MTGLFSQPAQPGILPADTEARLEAASAGVQLAPIDLGAVVDKAGLMAALADDLEFPDWFGRNWDAVADLLTDAEVVGARPGLLLIGLSELRAAAPQLAEQFEQVLLNVQAVSPLGLWLLADGGPGATH